MKTIINLDELLNVLNNSTARTEEAWWNWHDEDDARWSGGDDETATSDAEARCAAWIAGSSSDGPDEESQSLYYAQAHGLQVKHGECECQSFYLESTDPLEIAAAHAEHVAAQPPAPALPSKHQPREGDDRWVRDDAGNIEHF